MSPEELFDHAARKDVAYGHKPSMLQDVEAGRATEIDFLNGAIVAFGERHGVDAPLNRALTALIKGVEEAREMTSQQEIERRYATRARGRGAADGLDAVVVAGSEYTGFEGAVRYLSGFRILHRYAYVVLPVEGEPSVVFPQGGALGRRPLRGVDRGQGLRRASGPVDRRPRRSSAIGVYGLDYVMPVRDYRPLADGRRSPWDQGFDLARAVKSEEELESVRESFRINEEGFWAVLERVRGREDRGGADGRGRAASSPRPAPTGRRWTWC